MNFVKSSSRNVKWDNVKCLLIFCVVIGHVIYRFVDNNMLARSIYLMIYTFHMPVFIFLSGMFSKRAIKDCHYEKVLFYLLIYVVMKFAQSFVGSLKSGKMSFRFFWESGPGWYALAMAVYFFVSFLLNICMKEYDKRKLLIIALLIGIFWGYDDHMGDHFCSARILNFYPFFVAGSCVEQNQLADYMKGKKAKAASVLVLMLTIWVCFSKIDSAYWTLKLLKGKYPFADMDIHTWQGAVVRLLYYLFTVLIGYAIMTIVSERKTIFTDIGKRTLPIFAWHTAVINFILDVCNGQQFLGKMWPIHYVQGFILFACVIVLLCSSYPFEQMTKGIQCLTQIKSRSQCKERK